MTAGKEGTTAMDLLEYLSTPQPRPADETLRDLLASLDRYILADSREPILAWMFQTATGGRFLFEGRWQDIARGPLPRPSDVQIVDLLTDVEPDILEAYSSPLAWIIQRVSPEICAASQTHARDAGVDQFFFAWIAVMVVEQILTRPERVPNVLQITESEELLPSVAAVLRKRIERGLDEIERTKAILDQIAAIDAFTRAYAKALAHDLLSLPSKNTAEVVTTTIQLMQLGFYGFDNLIEMITLNVRAHFDPDGGHCYYALEEIASKTPAVSRRPPPPPLQLELVLDRAHERIRRDREGLTGVVGEVLTYLEDRVFEPSLDVASTLRAVSGSATSTAKRFRAAMGRPISQYLLERRYEAACILVRRTQLDFGLIAKAIGFGSGTTFSKFYRKWSGRLPREDRGRDDE